MIVSIGGVIGAGKSSVIKYIRDNYKRDLFDIELLEPMAQYCYFEGFHPLDEMYSSPYQNTAITQHHILKVLSEYFKVNVEPGQNVIMERSLDETEVFIKTYNSIGMLNDFCAAYLHKELKSLTTKDVLCPDVRILLDIDVDIALSRIAKRGRYFEKDQENMKKILPELQIYYDLYRFKYQKQNEDCMMIDVSNLAVDQVAAKVMKFIAECASKRGVPFEISPSCK